MPKEIKFRAWDKKGKIMWNDIAISDIPNPHTDKTINLFFSCNSEYFDFMQFTGLKDKNGKEIYEGDIVKMINGTTQKPNYQKVKWLPNDGMWGLFNLRDDYEFTLGDALQSQQGFTYEVIGNIYENPELLK